uniref:Uncharacterized protein n=1 Tax=Loa loa TaxID=7209 RepID=A0A1I7VXX5_LOALO
MSTEAFGASGANGPKCAKCLWDGAISFYTFLYGSTFPHPFRSRPYVHTHTFDLTHIGYANAYTISESLL